MRGGERHEGTPAMGKIEARRWRGTIENGGRDLSLKRNQVYGHL